MLFGALMLISAAVVLPTRPDYLTTVQSETVPTEGSAAEIASRGEVCIARALGSGVVGGELIVSRNIERGVVVARNALSYSGGFLLVWQMRSRVTFEARDGRFRITHENIERLNEQAGGWTPVGKWRGSGWEKAEAALQAQSAEIAACVVGSGGTADDW